jgi:hypothetical protein
MLPTTLRPASERWSYSAVLRDAVLGHFAETDVTSVIFSGSGHWRKRSES